jgi:hypothetical protein
VRQENKGFQTLHPLRSTFVDAIYFWEPRRVLYNLALLLVSIAWVVFSWPHFRQSLTWQHFWMLSILALLANACYCFAYLVDLLIRQTPVRIDLRGWRWVVWTAGTLFALLLANYWIADEIYPFPR